MDEKSKEFVAAKKWDRNQTVIFAVTLIVVIGYTAAALYFFPPVAVVSIFGFLAVYYMLNTFKAEYAYTISNKLTAEVLRKGGKRERISEFSISDMTVCAPVGRADYKDKLDSADEIIYAATDKNDVKTYFALFEIGDKKKALLFTPTEMMLNELDRHTSHKSVR